ncbi:hypothetical protein KAX35_08785, partial [candidate division WOR-3 bacterium]|nr:hypothetical protein [candidate division WOR-3 bacterium]
CDGTAYADVGWSTFKKNGKGEYESYSAVESPYKEIIAHGTGKLVNGQVYISFDNSFSEFISSDLPTQITVTPKSGTGLYVPERSTRGFTVKSWGGDPNCEFDWIAIGREKGHEQRTVLHDLDEEMRLAALEEEREMAERQRMEERRGRREEGRKKREERERERMKIERHKIERKTAKYKATKGD